jgi:hypothetical protein
MRMSNLFGLVVILATTSYTVVVVADSTNIEGQWQCLSGYQGNTAGSGMVSFDKNGQCIIGGQPFTYKLLEGNTLQISTGSATDSYTYKLGKDKLQLSYRDGSTFDCTRQAASSTPDGLLNQSGKGQPQAGNNEWQLQGTFCHYSGSSSYNSSYSSTSRITFDGRGHWSMGSESSFSSDAGSAYSGGGVDNSGVYRINGRQVIYATNSGEQGVATVNMQQNDGRITEIYVGEDLYSPSLCN